MTVNADVYFSLDIIYRPPLQPGTEKLFWDFQKIWMLMQYRDSPQGGDDEIV